MVDAGAGGDTQPAGLGSAMLPMLFLMLMMMSLMMFPGIRNSLSDGAGTVIEPLLFGIFGLEEFFVPTVFILGSSIMIVNTIIRSFFMDPLKQAHHSHRSKQISQQMREARMSRDTAQIDKMQKLQMEMMPEQMAMQGAMMKPMMFTMIFIIGIFSWMADTVLDFRVDYVSLPWQPMWGFENKVMWVFPAWIATYITMSAPLGRIVDRHLKLLRYKTHPVVLSGELIPEPLLYLLEDDKSKSSSNNRTRRSQRKRAGPRKTGIQSPELSRRGSGNLHVAPPQKGTKCPSCNSDLVNRNTRGLLRCDICRTEWR
ncbi:MAG TPA: TMCO1/EMC3 family protein [Candidatus Thalassarchaeaceae archaeon]|jgi:uncharacterized membrane protein (DUF106 family)|nr:TMCO1/EMC3 family protein [Euryarchaeota archaeon]MBT4475928.1 TMCO1/EMC3 family protein [Euryarchaeota archaeon]MBT6075782.1 TMCO1/EMC3 family protein [Euryarchaeota archaeon]DAC61645.1 MAG TPA: DUF106 domain-containing protein [Candidatus Poseidoniales archaeon]HII13189.1 TMCO1/EMC3 family protein [Candidatus Thalassarchaeaceae archaeon]